MSAQRKKPAKPKHGKFRVWVCEKGRDWHCWHTNRQGLRRRCCWCGCYEEMP